jgi:hypothetical protein
VDRRGAAFTTRRETEAEAARRAERLRAVWALAVALNGLAALLAVGAYALGGETWGATGGLVAAACLPLLVAVPVLAWVGERRPRRWHRERPRDFG